MGPTAARWHARFVLAAKGIEVDESALVLQLVNASKEKTLRADGQCCEHLRGGMAQCSSLGSPSTERVHHLGTRTFPKREIPVD
jgi:hypothetical protein